MAFSKWSAGRLYPPMAADLPAALNKTSSGRKDIGATKEEKNYFTKIVTYLPGHTNFAQTNFKQHRRELAFYAQSGMTLTTLLLHLGPSR
jgi:hypothetical protein